MIHRHDRMGFLARIPTFRSRLWYYEPAIEKQSLHCHAFSTGEIKSLPASTSRCFWSHLRRLIISDVMKSGNGQYIVFGKVHVIMEASWIFEKHPTSWHCVGDECKLADPQTPFRLTFRQNGMQWKSKTHWTSIDGRWEIFIELSPSILKKMVREN